MKRDGLVLADRPVWWQYDGPVVDVYHLTNKGMKLAAKLESAFYFFDRIRGNCGKASNECDFLTGDNVLKTEIEA